MKVRIDIMKKVFAAAGLCAASFILSGATAAHERSECEAFKGEVSATLVAFPAPGVTFGVGAVAYTIGGESRIANVTLEVLEMSPPAEDGTIHLTSRLQHDFLNGDVLTWKSRTVLSPGKLPGEFRLNERMHLESGAGEFSGYGGIGIGRGSISMNNQSANIRAKGWLCEWKKR